MHPPHVATNPVRRFRHAHHRTVLVGLLVAALLWSCDRPGQHSEPASPARKFVDLLRLVDPTALDDERVSTLQMELAEDSRVALRSPAPGRVEIGSIDAATGCELKFGIGLNPRAWGLSDGVVFEVAVRQRGEERQVFSELLDPQTIEEPQWLDRVVPLELEGTDPFEIVLVTDPHLKRHSDDAAWSAPHIVCPDALKVQPTSRPSVVLISLDTLRWDRLGVYGYGRDTSPVLDALAEESVVFENAFSTSSYTLPSHGSMFTGLFPPEHGAGHASMNAPLPEEMTTVAEILRDIGYRTIGFTAGGVMTQELGVHQGFEEWTERQRANLPSMLPSVFDALGRAADQPFLLFLHTFDVHAPYMQPPQHRYFESSSAGNAEDEETWRDIVETHYHRHHRLERFGGVEAVRDAYDSGIRFVDSQLAKLFAYLRELGRYDDTLIIVTSDHGESLFENGRYFGHGHTLNDLETRIPLVVRAPGASEVGRRSDFVQLVDFLPTILEVTGVPSDASYAGRPLLGQAADASPRELVMGETSITGSRFVRSAAWKVSSPVAAYWERRRPNLFGAFADRFPRGWQVFDLATDPAERLNLFGRDEPFPEEVRRVVRELQTMSPPGLNNDEAPPPDGELARNLRALGYLD